MSKTIQSEVSQIGRSQAATLLFAALPPAVREALRREARAVRFPAGAMIQQRGERSTGFWLIEEGTVAVGQFLGGGDFRAIGLLGPGDSYGELAILSGRDRVVDAVAREPAVLHYIPAARFERALHDDPMAMRALLAGLAAQLQETLELLIGIRRGTTVQRAAGLLANLARAQAEPRRLPITQQEIADLLGVTRATANAALKELERCGLILRNYGAVTVPDSAVLKRAFPPGSG